MAVNINATFPCNCVDSLYNKGEKQSVKLPASKVAIAYKSLGIVILKPIIDKLTFGFSPTEEFLKLYAPGENLKDYKRHIKSSLWLDAKDADNKTLVPVKDVPFKKAPYKNYNVNLLYTPPSATKPIFIQVDPKSGDKFAFMRFDMNPSHYSKKALGDFRAFIEETLLISGADITYDLFITWAKIYRADVAVDILGARPSELEIVTLKGKKPFPAKSHAYKSKTGRTETLYPKVKKGKSSAEYMYDKRQEQIDKDEKPTYGDILHSRYECRIQKSTFQKLSNIKNRCNRISVRALDYNKLPKLHFTHHLFIRHALHRTLDKALELIPAKHKPKYKQSYNTLMHNIWDANKLWSHWKETVETSGLFFSKK